MSVIPSWSNPIDRVKHGIDMSDDELVLRARFVSMKKVDNVENACKILDKYGTIVTIVADSQRSVRKKLREKEVTLNGKDMKTLLNTFEKIKLYQRETIYLSNGCIMLVKIEPNFE